MAFRRKTRRSSKPRDLIWVNKFVEIAAVDTAVVGGDIMDATNWAINTAFDRCTLLRIVGTISWTQTANATSADVPYLAWALYKDAAGLTSNIMDPSVASGTESFDILHWTHAALASTAAGGGNPVQREAVDVRTKRKMTSGDSIYLTARIPADTAAPTCNLVAQLRFLLDRG